MLAEVGRARGLYELAISQPVLDMPEAVWKAYIDFEIGQVSCGAVRLPAHVSSLSISLSGVTALQGNLECVRLLHEQLTYGDPQCWVIFLTHASIFVSVSAVSVV